MRSIKQASTLLPIRRLFFDTSLNHSRHYRYSTDASHLDQRGRVVYYNPPATYRGTEDQILLSQYVSKPLAKALEQAFPAVRYATKMQQELFEAMKDGKDMFLKDHTGTGKSFGLLLALLDKPRKSPLRLGRQRTTSLMIVPHRDLAYQFQHWIERIHAHLPQPENLASLAQVVARNTATPLSDQISRLHADSPHLLIGTPQALLDILEKDPSALILEGLSTIVVDEVDYLLENWPRFMDKYDVLKAERRLRTHPTPTRQILNKLYDPKFRPCSKKKQKYWIEPSPSLSETYGMARPQLVMSSATFRVSLRNLILRRSGWFPKERNNLIRITGSTGPDKEIKPSIEDRAFYSLGGSSIEHHALVVSKDGRITNIKGAINSRYPTDLVKDNTASDSVDSDAQPPSDEVLTTRNVPESVPKDESVDESASEPLPFNPNTLEAIAEAFALDVPRLALLVLPATAPLQRVVTELHGLGVNAHGLDVLEEESGGKYLTEEAPGPATDNPTLIVSTLASTRGLDMPGLTHVFIAGVPEDQIVDTYLHAAGRVGRFGRSGKVVAVLQARHRVKTAKGKPAWKDEQVKMLNAYKLMHITPIKLEHFA